ncbi:MAG: hypothetical protein R2728_11650 [Chitinophagales bacterium]
MSKHWTEKYDPNIHKDFMSTYHVGGSSIDLNKLTSEKKIYFVRECSFTFQFINLNQLDEMIEFVSSKVQPSSRREIGLDHWWHSWKERLPKGLLKGSKRDKILKALEKARLDF